MDNSRERMKSTTALAILGLVVVGITAPATAMASDGMTGDMPRLVITVVCTVYSDYLGETLTNIGMASGQVMPGCEMTTEYVGSTPAPVATVDIPEGALFPDCAETEDCFDPYTVTVEAGTKVTWTNSDTVMHTVTDVGGAFDGWLLPGEEFSFAFEDAGTYMYGCVIHPWAGGMVVVKPGEAGSIESTQPGQAADAADTASEWEVWLSDQSDSYDQLTQN